MESKYWIALLVASTSLITALVVALTSVITLSITKYLDMKSERIRLKFEDQRLAFEEKRFEKQLEHEKNQSIAPNQEQRYEELAGLVLKLGKWQLKLENCESREQIQACIDYPPRERLNVLMLLYFEELRSSSSKFQNAIAAYTIFLHDSYDTTSEVKAAGFQVIANKEEKWDEHCKEILESYNQLRATVSNYASKYTNTVLSDYRNENGLLQEPNKQS